jgi:very-short-patch-repair endonuclease
LPFAEVVLWNHMKGRQLLGYKFRRQHGVARYVLDFYCPTLRLGIEVDGESHCDPESKTYDAKRQDRIESLGITVVRIPDAEIIENIEGVIEMLAAEIKRLEKTPPSPP